MTGRPLDQLREPPGGPAGEPREHRLKRLAMRSMRRGIKEMDIILSKYARDFLDGMDERALDAYEALLSENDQDLYQWVSGQQAAPGHHASLIEKIAAHSGAR